MIHQERARWIQEQRDARLVDENESASVRRKAARHEPGSLGELINALAQGLASIGLPNPRGRGFPASPAY